VPPVDRKRALPTADGKGIQLPARSRDNAAPQATRANSGGDSPGAVGIGFTSYVPGRALSDFRPYNSALLVPAGYDVNWTIHYTPR